MSEAFIAELDRVIELDFPDHPAVQEICIGMNLARTHVVVTFVTHDGTIPDELNPFIQVTRFYSLS